MIREGRNTQAPFPPLPRITVPRFLPRFLSKTGEWMETVAVLCKTPTSGFHTERQHKVRPKGKKNKTIKQTDGESSIPRATMPKSDGWLSTVAALVPPIGHFHTLFLTMSSLEELLSRLGLRLMSHPVFEISEQYVKKGLKFIEKTLISLDVPLSRHVWKVREFLKEDRWNWYPGPSLTKKTTLVQCSYNLNGNALG